MSSSDQPRRHRGILANVGRIHRHVANLTADQFGADEKTQGAVERCLERIVEAGRKIGHVLDAKYPEAEWHKLRQLGSVLRYGDDDIDPELLWRFVTVGLDKLEAACQRELGET